MSTDASSVVRSRTCSDLLATVPQDMGPRVATPGGGALHVVRPPGSLTFSSPADFVSIMLAPLPGMRLQLGSESARAFDAQIGTLIVHPAEVESHAAWSHQLEYLGVGFVPGLLAAIAEEELGIAELELRPPNPGYVDEKALNVAQLIRQELAGAAASELYVDSLMTVLGLHVVRHHSTVGARAGAASPVTGLPAVCAMRVKEFLDEHFAEKVSIATLAELAHLSPGRFIHAFARTFGIPPHRYVINLRLAHAAHLLADTNNPIAEIAYQSGFSSQSHLTATLRKYRGVTPAQLRSGNS